MQKEYQQNGYVLKRRFFTESELDAVEPILRRFHAAWLVKHRDHYDHQAINSAYITHPDTLSTPDRQKLFNFVAMDKLVNAARDIIPAGPAFMNTQLFFNPKNNAQKNYWHRDIQYVPYDVERQQEMMASSTVLHFRIALADEPGIELVPGTHRRWDDTQEFETRIGENGRRPSDDLPGGKAIPLKRGDLLVFSANMIHRGLYGGNRFAFDIIYSDADPKLLKFVDPKCLPNPKMLGEVINPEIFEATRQAIQEEGAPKDTPS